MSRRIEIELTSARSDGTWTWRVAGAKQPKGVVDGSLLPNEAKVGDVLRADAEFELEGTIITSVVAPPAKREPDLLKLLGDGRPFEAVTTSLVPKGGRPRRDRDDHDRPDRGDARPARRADGPGSRPARAPGNRPDSAARSDRPSAPRPERDGSERRPPRPSRDRPVSARPGEASPDRPDRTPAAARGRPERKPPTGPPRPRRLNPGSVYRTAVLDSLAPEERAVAEQLLQGGVPAVRRAMQEQNTKAKEEGRPEIKADALVALAEELLPRLKAAEWRDRAEAVTKEIDEIHIRDLRSVIAGADAGARDDESRILAKTLREALERRETAEREAWLGDVTTCLDEGRVARALRVAGRPPDPRTRVPAELTTRLSDAASQAMSPDTPPDRWTQLLGALLESPVRRSVKPIGFPASPGDELLTAARQAVGRVPALAALLGLNMPPPPGPPRPGMRPPRPRPPAPNRGVPRSQPPKPQSVIDAAPTPVVDAAPTPVVDAGPTPVVEASPTPVVDEAPTPVVDAPPAPVVDVAPPSEPQEPQPVAEPETTLPALETPFAADGHDRAEHTAPADQPEAAQPAWAAEPAE